MEYEKCVCPVLNVNGVMATGKQYDLDITLPDGNVENYHKSQIIDLLLNVKRREELDD